MRIEYFKYLIEIEKCGSISSAAKVLYMGQTTLSSIVKTIEDKLGFSIFQRTSKGVYPTNKGKELLEICKEINLKLDRVRLLSDGKWNDYDSIYLFLCPSINMGITLELLDVLSKKFQQYRIIFQEDNRIDVVSKICLQNGSIGITYLLNHEIREIASVCRKYNTIIKEVVEDRFYLCVSKRHALAQRKLVNIDELYEYKYVTCSKYYVEFFKKFQHNHNNFISLSNMQLVVDAILGSEAFGFFTGYFASFYLNKELFTLIPIANLDFENVIKICLIVREPQSMRYFEKETLLCIEEYFNMIKSV